jgi:hypothetical protein
MNVEEKLRMAAQLAKLGVDVIEAGFPISSESDFEAVKAVSQNIKVRSFVGCAASCGSISTVPGKPYNMPSGPAFMSSAVGPTSTSSTNSAPPESR